MIKLLGYIVWSVGLCFLLLVLSNTANAQNAENIYWQNGTGSTVKKYATSEKACRGVIADRGASYTFASVTATSLTTATCYQYFNNSSTPSFAASLNRYTCNAAIPFFDPVQNKCVAGIEPPPPLCDYPKGEKMTFSVKEGSSDLDADSPDVIPPFPTSSPTCYYEKMLEVNGCYSYTENNRKNYACTYTAISNGIAVAKGQGPQMAKPKEAVDQDESTMPPKTAPDDKSCPRGTVNVGLSSSGIPMCVGQGTDPKNPPAAPPKVEVEKNETLPDGSTQNTKSVTTKNADGSTTTVKTVTVTKPTGEKETTQDKNTTKTPGGKPGKETEQPQQQNICKQNPNLSMCKNSTVGGKCGETSCTGDAIQCATLRAAAILQCKAEKDELDLKASPLAAKGQSAMDGSDMEGLPGPKNGLVVNVNTMKSEGWLGNGAAFEDVSVNLRGQEILIPLSKWSSYLLPFRYMLMIIASLISYRILAGAVLKE